jgi:hypothetical protein
MDLSLLNGVARLALVGELAETAVARQSPATTASANGSRFSRMGGEPAGLCLHRPSNWSSNSWWPRKTCACRANSKTRPLCSHHIGRPGLHPRQFGVVCPTMEHIRFTQLKIGLRNLPVALSVPPSAARHTNKFIWTFRLDLINQRSYE